MPSAARSPRRRCPADSWPRCWSAWSPKYASRATSRPGAWMPNTPHISECLPGLREARSRRARACGRVVTKLARRTSVRGDVTALASMTAAFETVSRRSEDGAATKEVGATEVLHRYVNRQFSPLRPGSSARTSRSARPGSTAGTRVAARGPARRTPATVTPAGRARFRFGGEACGAPAVEWAASIATGRPCARNASPASEWSIWWLSPAAPLAALQPIRPATPR